MISDERHIDAHSLFTTLDAAVSGVRQKSRGTTQFNLAKKVKEYDSLKARHRRAIVKLEETAAR